MDSFNQEARPRKGIFAAGPGVIWLGTAVLAGSLLTGGLLFSDKKKELKLLEQQMADREILYLHTTDSLSDALVQSTTSYNVLMADKNLLSDNLAKEKVKSTRLTNENVAFASREHSYRTEYNKVKAALDKSTTENETLKSDANSLKSQIAYMQSMLEQCNRDKTQQGDVIDQQQIKLEEAVSEREALLDSLWAEDVSGYFNNAELTAGYGLSEINVPFSTYFGGITDINGYVINKHFRTGLGVGLHYYDGGFTSPLFLDLRYMFNKRLYTPYIFADGGFMIEYSPFRVPNSVFMNPGIGLHREVSDRFSLNLGAGLFVQSFNIRSSFINVKVGVTFKKPKE